MNLARHAAVMWRYRAVTIAGLGLGLVLALFAAFQLPSLERRGTEVWSSESKIMVTQPGFPWGRVTLPDAATADDVTTPGGQTPPPTKPGKEGLRFAEPDRFANLALLYSNIANSDEVRLRLPEKPARGQIQALATDATGNGTTFLPIITLTTKAATEEGAHSLNKHTYEALKGLLETEQKKNDIAPPSRIALNLINAPSKPELVSGRSFTASILAFMLCCLAALAIAHVLENFRLRKVSARTAAGQPNLTPVGPTPTPAGAGDLRLDGTNRHLG
jgi:hypothetical protein